MTLINNKEEHEFFEKITVVRVDINKVSKQLKRKRQKVNVLLVVLEFRCLRKFHISVIGEKYVRNRSVIALYIICVRDYGAKKSRESVINSMYIKPNCEKFNT